MTFLVDAQLPIALARFLRQHGHVAELGMTAAADGAIWDLAVVAGAVIVSKDEDVAVRRLLKVGGLPPVVWLRVGNCSNRVLLTWIAPLLQNIVTRLTGGDVLVEVVRSE